MFTNESSKCDLIKNNKFKAQERLNTQKQAQ